MYHTIEEFLTDWKSERASTLKVFANLTDDSLNKKVSENGRSLGRLAWHITTTLSEMMGSAGLQINRKHEEIKFPESASEIVNAYQTLSDELSAAIKENWSDEALMETIPMYGEVWRKEKVLNSLIKHQIHHRGQVTVLMRQAGLKVPGIYGPSFEEWSDFGLEPEQ